MAWYHVNSCDCPVGCCDCGTPSEPPPQKKKKEIKPPVGTKDSITCLDCKWSRTCERAFEPENILGFCLEFK